MIAVHLTVLAAAGVVSFLVLAWLDRRRDQPGPDAGLSVLDGEDERERLIRGQPVDRRWLNRQFAEVITDVGGLTPAQVQALESLYIAPVGGMRPGTSLQSVRAVVA